MRKYVLVFLIVSAVLATSASASFESWAESSPHFTVGNPERVNIYVRNIDDLGSVDYKIEVNETVATCESENGPADCSHLVHVILTSDQILGLSPDESGYTIGTVVVVGPISEGQIRFMVNGPSGEEYPEVKFGASLPVALPEFTLVHIILMMALSGILLIISDRFFFRT